MFEVILAPEARAFYADADQPLARKLARCFAQLERDPRHGNNIKRLTGDLSGRLRYRVGDWQFFIGSTIRPIGSTSCSSPTAARSTNDGRCRPAVNPLGGGAIGMER